MSVQLRRKVSVLASISLLGLALSSATGCGAAAVVVNPNVASSVAVAASEATSAPAADTETVASTDVARRDVAGQTVEGTKLEIAGMQALIDQETQSLAAKGLSARDKAEHQSTLAKLMKMKSESEADLVALEQPSVAASPVAADAHAKLAPLAGATLPGTAKLSSAVIPAPAQLARLPGGLGAALGSASAVANAAKDPKAAAMGLAKLGASHIPGGSSVLGAAGSVASLAQDPKGAAKDLAKQGAMTAANKLPIPAGLKGSLFGGSALTK